MGLRRARAQETAGEREPPTRRERHGGLRGPARRAFLALPTDVGPLRDHFLGNRQRDGHSARVGAEIASTEETVEALTAGLGICLVAGGNVRTLQRDGIAVLDVTGLPDLDLVLAWRREDTNPAIARLVEAVQAVRDSVGERADRSDCSR